MSTDELTELNIQVVSEGAGDEELDQMTRQLLTELKEMDVEQAALAKGDLAPAGSKAIDPITTGSIVLTVLPSLLPKIIEGVQSWAMRGSNRTVKFKGRVGGQSVEFEGSGDDLQRLLMSLEKTRQKK